jgi:HlyD family secretion protein
MSATTTSSTITSRLATVLPELDPVATVTTEPSRRPPVRALAAGAIVVVIAIVAALSGVFASSGSDYRTVVASTQNVNAALSGVATIEPQLEATIAFPAAGTVTSVSVQIGDKVSAGQTVAQLDPQSLAQTVDQQMATLTQDQLTLTNAMNGQSTTSGGLGGTGGAAGGSASTTASGLSSEVTPAATHSGVLLAVRTAATSPAIAAAQQAVLQDQTQVDTAQGTAQSDVGAAITACGFTPITAPELMTCQTDIGTLNNDEQMVKTALSRLAAASSTLDQLLNQAASTPSTKPATSGGSSGGFSSGSAGHSSASAAPTAADLSADQAAVDAAVANVAVAQQALAQATLTSPINGTVDAVNLVVGASVTAGSTTENIVVQGSGGYQVSTTIGIDNIPHVAVGQPATVVPDGAHKTLPGKVASISIAPNSTSALSTTYLVVIGLKHPNLKLGNGSTGTVTITTQHAKSTLAVPTSAVTTSGTSHTVEVLAGNTPRKTTVRVGVVGYTWTQITSGLKAGQQVVLAQLSQPLPGSATTATTSPSSSSASTTLNGSGSTLFGGRGGGAGRGG